MGQENANRKGEEIGRGQIVTHLLLLQKIGEKWQKSFQKQFSKNNEILQFFSSNFLFANMS